MSDRTEKALRIAVSDVQAKKSAVSELVLQQLEIYGVTSDAGGGALENVDLLVTTGAEFSANATDHPQLLILDATEENKKSLLGKIGFHTAGDAWAYFVAEIGPRHFRVIELAKDDSVGVHKVEITPVDETQPPTAAQLRSATKTVVTRDRPDLAAEELVSAILDFRIEENGDAAREAGASEIPPDVKKWTISYTLLRKGSINAFGKTQEPTMSITYDIVAMLNDPPAGVRYQYIYIHQKGVVKPGDLMDYSTYYKGFGQFRVDTSISPTSHLGDLVHDASSPPNVNDKREIASKIGFSVQYTEKDGGAAKFDYEHSISQEVFDWQIIEQTSMSNMRWTFAERYPFNYMAMVCAADAGDTAPFDYWGRVKEFPNLTRYTLQPQTQSVWRTLKVLNEPVTFNAVASQTLRYFWYRFVVFECHQGGNAGTQRMTVDLSKVSG